MDKHRKNFAVRTQLRAGDLCEPHDTNCIARDSVGNEYPRVHNTCHRGRPFAGTDCILAVTSPQNKDKNIFCYKC